tara:strand:+ start:213 stop:728 length:516 start_codon:yes stop_codon:yes gene_type:complete
MFPTVGARPPHVVITQFSPPKIELLYEAGDKTVFVLPKGATFNDKGNVVSNETILVKQDQFQKGDIIWLAQAKTEDESSLSIRYDIHNLSNSIYIPNPYTVINDIIDALDDRRFYVRKNTDEAEKMNEPFFLRRTEHKPEAANATPKNRSMGTPLKSRYGSDGSDTDDEER